MKRMMNTFGKSQGPSEHAGVRRLFVLVKIDFITAIKTQSALCNGKINDWESEEDLAFNRCQGCN